jgi:hypothetical protein
MPKPGRYTGAHKFVICPFNPCLRRTDRIRSLERTSIGWNFLVSKKNPEIKVPRRCRCHRSLEYIVWEPSLVMGQSAVLRFLTLKKLSARDIRAKLDTMFSHRALCLSAMKKWHKRFVNVRITLEDNPRSGRPSRSDLCESLWDMIDETPFISCKRMCQKLRIPKTTYLCVLQEDLWFRKCYLRWVPHSIASNERNTHRDNNQ